MEELALKHHGWYVGVTAKHLGSEGPVYFAMHIPIWSKPSVSVEQNPPFSGPVLETLFADSLEELDGLLKEQPLS